MAQIINTNISALNAQRNLNRSQAAGMQAMQRLSSGLRINSAKDDAAGLGISDRMSSQIRGQNQAVRNANDGISMVQTGDGALAEMTNNLQRIRELAVQSSNVTNTAADRAAIDLEVQQRLSEIDRTASTTSFNGQKLLNGNMGDAKFQIGANAGEVIKLGLGTDVRIAASGKVATTTSGSMGAGAVDGHISSSLNAVTGLSATTANFLAQGTSDSAGSVVITAARNNFSGSAATNGTSAAQVVDDGYDFSKNTVILAPATFTTAAASVLSVNGGDLTLPANMIQFDVTVNGVTAGITLNSNYANDNDAAADIEDQIQATTGNGDVTVTHDGTGFVFTNVGKSDEGGTSANIVISNSDANATTAVLVAAGGATFAGTDPVADSSAQFTLAGSGTAGAIDLQGTFADRAAILSEIQDQLLTVGGGNDTYSAALDGSNIVFTNKVDGTAVTVGGFAGKAADSGFVAGVGTTGATAGGATASMVIDGTTVTLDQNYASDVGVAGAIQNQLGTINYTVTENGSGEITIARNTVGTTSTAINIASGNAGAQSGFTEVGAGVGTVTGVAGAFGTAAGDANFNIDGIDIVLNDDYTNRAGVGDEIRTQLGSGYTVKTGVDGDNVQNVVSSALDLNFTLATNGPASFTVDGKTITLNTNLSAAPGDGAAAIQAQLNAGTNSNITVSFDTNNGNKLTFTRTGLGANGEAQNSAIAITGADSKAQALGISDSNGSAGTVLNQILISKNGSATAININNSDANAAAAGFGVASGVAGTAGGAVTLDNLTINGTSMAGSFTSTQALADKINGDVAGVYASVTGGALKLTSASEITLGGAEAGTLGGTFAAGVKAADSGSLSTANTLTVDAALDTIQRVDNALSTVTTLRSTLGAVQNRFQSVIANLESTSENLSAARSRIQDADFAAESAELSRTQVLQQAGTAMLAQANQSSQGVMALLR